MRTFLLLLIALTLPALAVYAQHIDVPPAMIVKNVPPLDLELRADAAPYTNVRTASVVGWLPNNQGLLFKTRFGETSQFHKVIGPGQYRQQLTFFDEPAYGGSISNSLRQPGFVFRKDAGGNEDYQLFYYDLTTNQSAQITSGEGRSVNPIVSNLGDRVLYASTARNKKDYDFVVQPLDRPGRAQRIFDNEGAWFPVSWSADDKKISAVHYESNRRSRLYLFDVKEGSIDTIPAEDEYSSFSSGLWSADGGQVFFTSDDGGLDHEHLKVYDAFTKTVTDLTPEFNWSVEQIALSPDRKRLLFSVNENGYSVLYMLFTDLLKFKRLDAYPEGIVSGFEWHPDNERVALTYQSATSAADVFVLHTKNLTMERWTYSEVGALPIHDLVAPQLIHYPAHQAKNAPNPDSIPAFLYQPASIGPHPVLIYIHGGPESQFRPRFNTEFQYLVNELNIAIIAPNVRGSSGYGKRYQDMDNGMLRENSVFDIGTLLDWIEEQPDLDESRIVVTGGSYGGYMTLASLVHYSDRLRGGIETVGISDFITFLENTKAYRRDLRRAEYGDERDPAMRAHMKAIAPVRQTDKITAPLMVVQGANDPRVPASEAEQIVAAMEKAGHPVWYLLAENEGHGFRKKVNRDFYVLARAQFLKTYLLPLTSPDNTDR